MGDPKPAAWGQARPLDIPTAEYNLAAERIGQGPPDALRWLLRFAEHDLTKLSRGQLLDLQLELIAFASESVDEASSRLEWGLLPADAKRPDALLDKLPETTLQTIQSIQRRIQGVLHGLCGES